MTMRPHRKRAVSADPEFEFEYPLLDYAYPTYRDKLERSLMEDTVVQAIKTTPFKVVSPDTTILQAMKMMDKKDFACLMVAEDDRLIGVFSERDILNKVAGHFNEIKDSPISMVMTHDPIVVYDNEPPAKALNLMAVAGFRHLPILDVDNRIVGILGPRRVTAYLQKFLELAGDQAEKDKDE